MNKLLFFGLTTSVILIGIFTIVNPSFSQDSTIQNLAKSIFDDKQFTVPSNVKNFVILIPNEAHESPELPKEQRLINQPYVPQKLQIDSDTNILWFSGDVGHTRQITIMDSTSAEVFNSKIKFNSATQPLVLPSTGKFNYFEKNANSDDPNFVMEGSITVVNSNNQTNTNENNSRMAFDTISVIMIPAIDLNKNIITLKDNKINIIDQYFFKDLRETGGGGANQTLLILGSNIPLEQIISALSKITDTLPYS